MSIRRGLKITNRDKGEGERENSSLDLLKQHLKSPEDFANALNILIGYIAQEKGISPDEIIKLIIKEKKPKEIPVCIFNDKLSALETIVKYLKENLNLKYSEIAKLLNRNDRTIWATYSNSRKKLTEKFVVKSNKFFIPALIISNRSFSVLESIVSYLKDNLNLRYSQIALMLHRDQRTVWTVYNRKRKK